MNIFRKKSISKVLADAQSGNSDGHGTGLVKSLSVTDLTAFGIAAIIGAGIFSTVGKAAAGGGPAISLLFLGFSLTCVFSAYCYAQFASAVPVSGSAYTYAYTSLGEVVAWLVGWNLVLEYGISNVVVAISWSEYFTTLLEGFNIHIPYYFTLDYLTAHRASQQYQTMLASGQNSETNIALNIANTAWQTAPKIGNFRIICDLPALLITFLMSSLVYIGIRESKNANNLLVVLKLIVIFIVIVVGAFYIKPQHWLPFMPEGIGGVMKGVAAVCFAYIGFDAISTTAEECKNPQRDIPRAMMYALGICTALYLLITFVLTGMVSYKELGFEDDPLAYVFKRVGVNFISGVVAVGAVIAMASAMLAYQIGQPRIWMAMSRDGLLPRIFSDIHPRYKTPWFSTIITGLTVAIPSLFFNLTELTDLTSIGTLFAFALVCGGVLLIDPAQSKFKIPYFNAKWVIPTGFIVICFLIVRYNNDGFNLWFQHLKTGNSNAYILLVFFLIWLAMAVWSFLKSLSLIPVLGFLFNLYLMTELGGNNWGRFGIWCVIGLCIYFAYGHRKSKLAQ